jgi:hypothetical protein
MMVESMQWRNQSHRPKGITFMSIIQIISSLFLIIPAALMIIPMALMASMFMYIGQSPFMMQSLLMMLPMIVPFINFSLGIFFVIVGHGLYVGKGWAWKYTIIIQVINFVFSLSFTLLMPLLIMPLLLESLIPMSSNIEGNASALIPMSSNIEGNASALIVNSIVSLIPTIVFFMITMAYMLRPRTRAYFGKVHIDIH